MMYEAIKLLFPDITDDQFRLQDNSDGNGPFIAYWGRTEPQPTMAQIQAEYPTVQNNQLEADVSAAVQKRLDDFAKTRNYDGIMSACTYATSPTAKFAAEGQYCVTSRDAHWAKCYDILSQAQAGTNPTPTVADVIAQMPALVWPV